MREELFTKWRLIGELDGGLKERDGESTQTSTATHKPRLINFLS